MSPPRGMHRCPGRCGRLVRRPACTRCLTRLPDELRTALIERQNPATPAAARLWARVVEETRDWLLEHPADPDPDHAIAGECEHCFEPIIWPRTAAGKLMPLDADPDENGNVVRLGKVVGVLGKPQAAAARRGGTELWMPHVATCPHADRWKATR